MPNDVEIRELSQQLQPLARDMLDLFYRTGIHVEPWRGLTPHAGYDTKTNEFTFRASPNDGPMCRFGLVRPREGAVWHARLVDTQVTGNELIRMDKAHYPNDSDSELEVEWNAQKEIQEGIESVKAVQSKWELGGSVKTAVAAEAGFSAFGAEAKVSASVEAEIHAEGGQEKTDEDRKNTQTTNTEERNHRFVVSPRSRLELSVSYEKGSGIAIYRKTLPVDMSFRLTDYAAGDGNTYHKYYRGAGSNYGDFCFGGDGVNVNSLLDWLSGFFGMSNCNDFREGLSIMFSSDTHDRDIIELVDSIRSNAMMVSRDYEVTLSNASNFTFGTKQFEI